MSLNLSKKFFISLIGVLMVSSSVSARHFNVTPLAIVLRLTKPKSVIGKVVGKVTAEITAGDDGYSSYLVVHARGGDVRIPISGLTSQHFRTGARGDRLLRFQLTNDDMKKVLHAAVSRSVRRKKVKNQVHLWIDQFLEPVTAFETRLAMRDQELLGNPNYRGSSWKYSDEGYILDTTREETQRGFHKETVFQFHDNVADVSLHANFKYGYYIHSTGRVRWDRHD